MDATVPVTTVLLAQAASAEGLGQLALPLAFLALLYVLLIRPQSKRRRELVRLVASLAEGDLVATVGGIHGEIVEIDDTTVDLAVTEDADGAPDVIIRLDRASIVRVLEKADAPQDGVDGVDGVDADDVADDGSDSV